METLGKQTNFAQAWAETDAKAEEMEPTFKPATGKVYALTFSDAFVGMISVPQRDSADQIMRDAAGNAILEKKDALVLWVDSIDDKKITMKNDERVGKIWQITSKNLRASLKLAVLNGNILKKRFQIEKTGAKFQTKYSVSEVGDR